MLKNKHNRTGLRTTVNKLQVVMTQEVADIACTLTNYKYGLNHGPRKIHSSRTTHGKFKWTIRGRFELL